MNQEQDAKNSWAEIALNCKEELESAKKAKKIARLRDNKIMECQ